MRHHLVYTFSEKATHLDGRIDRDRAGIGCRVGQAQAIRDREGDGMGAGPVEGHRTRVLSARALGTRTKIPRKTQGKIAVCIAARSAENDRLTHLNGVIRVRHIYDAIRRGIRDRDRAGCRGRVSQSQAIGDREGDRIGARRVEPHLARVFLGRARRATVKIPQEAQGNIPTQSGPGTLESDRVNLHKRDILGRCINDTIRGMRQFQCLCRILCIDVPRPKGMIRSGHSHISRATDYGRTDFSCGCGWQNALEKGSDARGMGGCGRGTVKRRGKEAIA
ncbi:hypothetical protein NKDENANG_02705 [Candidatus Entotheonellaceae bacterium PAL068K]